MTSVRETLETCWQACWHRARRPVEGVLVPEDLAASLAERILRNLAFDFDEPPPESKFLAIALEEATKGTKEAVSSERRQDQNPQRHHDPEDHRYPENLDLDRLQKNDPERGFQDREWNLLPPVLKPLAFAQLAKKGIIGADAEDVFNETLAELARERGSDHRAPISDLTVFEEIVPLQTRMLQFRSIDWRRRRSTLKNQPNAGESFDALTDHPDRPVQFMDPASANDATPRFEEIYRQCEEALDAAEWQLVFTLYIAQSATIQDLIQDESYCATLDLKPGASGSTRRRAIGTKLEVALEKLKKCLSS